MNIYEEISQRISSGEISNGDQLQKLKVQLSRKYGMDRVPSNSEILNSGYLDENAKDILRLKPTRTISGVAVVAAMTSPEMCPHGRCIFCPGGLENNSPQAYTGYEPSALRGRMNNYDPFSITFNRLKQLETIGHDTSKVDLIIMGGTFTARSKEYQESFVKGCLDGMNGSVSPSLEESIRINETSRRRCIGLTVETKPDWFFEKEIEESLKYGTTKVELGVQIINEEVLRLNHRGHGVEEIEKSTLLSKNAGLKIVYHVMPGMYGSDFQKDLESFRKMISDARFKPDMFKIYPTLVVKGTKLYNMWKAGEYTPMETEEAARLIFNFMKEMPPWIRVQRMQRDIPVKFIDAGVKRSDLRNMVDWMLKENKVKSKEIRGREIGFTTSNGSELVMKRIDYDASGSKEIFISFEDENENLASYLRLRKIPEDSWKKETRAVGMVREIKTVGRVVPIGQHDDKLYQHKGLGKRMLMEAERITREEFQYDRIMVISGIGVREYFRKLGYSDYGTYVSKSL
ncbi:tRNA uridine(34) 5-carboxymethylaminomethyl modification radical SAM/GNAT enzyme Elp3 [Cuniculiplasma sp. SKW3]|uniref:tRNA uridine(34) 5-carboxymethylaminomethyl modification radical SAM/GNAT enzyme Elp3 n=1 Tax=Cuniculiplasma sp. SKW3 TaxID=3400170 RepID=UPI003FCFFDC5